MAPTSTTANYSLFSIPAYVVIALLPHLYSANLLNTTIPPTKDNTKSTTKNIYNLPNPRSFSNASKYQSALPPATFARWERARAAHTHLQENAAFFVSAILAGIATKCEAGYMNRMAALYLATRVAYIVSYISVSGGPLTPLRTLWFFVGHGILGAMWWEAGKKVMAGDY